MKRYGVVALSAVLSLVVAVPVGASKPSLVAIVDTFGAGNFYTPFVSDGATAPPAYADMDYATSFVTPAGSNIRLSRITLPLTSRSATTASDADLVVVPDTTITNPTPSGDPTIHVPDTAQVLDTVRIRRVTQDFNGAVYSAKSRRNPILAPDTRYWLVMSTPTRSGQITWLHGPGTSQNLVAVRSDDAWYGFVWVSFTRTGESALRLEGTPL